jgi:DNA-binding transcriptional MerR regulator
LFAQVTWVNRVFKARLMVNQQVPLFPTESGDFIAKKNMVKHIELGAASLGKPIRSRTGAYLWGGHAYRRGIIHHLAASGVEVSKIQSLLRHPCASTAIIRYLGKSMARSSASLAEEAALGTTLEALRAEIKTLAAQLKTQQAAATALQEQRGLPDFSSCATLSPLQQSSSSTDNMQHATVPPTGAHAFVICTRETPAEGNYARRPHDGGTTYSNWAFLASTWASVVQDIPNDATLGARDWCPRCATFFARSANEETAGRYKSSTNSESTSSSGSI